MTMHTALLLGLDLQKCTASAVALPAHDCHAAAAGPLAAVLSALAVRAPSPCLRLPAAPAASLAPAGLACRLWRRLWRSRLSPFRLGLAAADGPLDSCRDLLRRRRML